MKHLSCIFLVIPSILFLTALPRNSSGQDTLPSFTATIKSKNKILVSWVNPFGGSIKQLSIQRSRDSAKLFKTIISLPDPTVLENGFLDQNLPDTNFYYRIYVLLEGGKYEFSPTKKASSPAPIVSTRSQSPSLPDQAKPGSSGKKPVTNPVEKPVPSPDNVAVAGTNKPAPQPPSPPKILLLQKDGEVIGEINESALQAFRDSISLRTKDTLLIKGRDTLVIKPFQAKEVFSTSRYIFVDKAGLVHIELPWFARRKYEVRFFEQDKTPFFEIREVNDAVLLLDKANFLQAGWYYFEIYEDGKLLEKNRLFISRDF